MEKLEKELLAAQKRAEELAYRLVKERLRGELLRRGARSVDLIAEYLSDAVRYDGGEFVVLDEEGNPRVRIISDGEGRYRPVPVTVEELVDEFLENNPHLLLSESSESESEEGDGDDLERQYEAAMEEAMRKGRPTGEFIKLMARRYRRS